MTLEAAYKVCRTIAKREAKNFYYAFRVLPAHKRNAMCAVYAFMRRADDIADDETLRVEERRQLMAAWLEQWRASRSGAATTDPVFLALGDTQRRFSVPDALLEELVQGTSMDLAEEGDGAVDVGEGLRGYETFDQLRRYCYLVASVVGLVCIRIFGYSDPGAEKLAEETGVAFQLTNILRDVKEDAERGRLYLPLDLLTEFGVTPQRIKAMAAGEALRPNERAMLYSLGDQAERSYRAAQELLPMIDMDSRAALWVMVTIYHRLLQRIAAQDNDVFSKRASVPTRVKLTILAQGGAAAIRNRMGA